MSWLKRIFLFMAVNVLILVTLSFTLNLLGVQPYLTHYGIDYQALMLFCLVWGMGGAFISLALSRIMAKWMMGVQVIDPAEARGEALPVAVAPVDYLVELPREAELLVVPWASQALWAVPLAVPWAVPLASQAL